MRTVGISSMERNAGILGAAALRESTAALREDGYVVLQHAVDARPLERLRIVMDRAAEAALARNPRVRRMQSAPPAEAPFVEREIVANPLVAQVTRALLGPRSYNNLYSADVNGPGSEAQPLHVDAGPLWPGLAQAHPAASLMINIPLVDTTDDNGSTEIWPGTHHDTRFSVFVSEDAQAARAAAIAPLRANVPAGSAIIRDARLWHRGTANRTASIRTVITMMHHIYWLERGAPMQFAAGCEAAFAGPDLISHVRFTDATAQPQEDSDGKNTEHQHGLALDRAQWRHDRQHPVDFGHERPVGDGARL